MGFWFSSYSTVPRSSLCPLIPFQSSNILGFRDLGSSLGFITSCQSSLSLGFSISKVGRSNEMTGQLGFQEIILPEDDNFLIRSLAPETCSLWASVLLSVL